MGYHLKKTNFVERLQAPDLKKAADFVYYIVFFDSRSLFGMSLFYYDHQKNLNLGCWRIKALCCQWIKGCSPDGSCSAEVLDIQDEL